MTEIQVIGGEITQGLWQANGTVGDCTMTQHGVYVINLSKMLKSVQEVTEDNKVDLGRAVASAAIGTLLAGPLGALGAVLLFGRRKTVTFLAELTDGRQFVGIIEKDKYAVLLATAVTNRGK